MAFSSSRFRRISHLVDAWPEMIDTEASLAEMMDVSYWPACASHGPNAREPWLEEGMVCFLRPADGERYQVWCKSLTKDGRPLLGFIRSSPPPAIAPRKAA